jgi:hypothetical protein
MDWREGASKSPLYVNCLSCILTCCQGCIPQIEKLLTKGREKIRKILFADPIIFRYQAGNPGSQLSMYLSQYDGQEDIVTVSLYVITYTKNIGLIQL